MFPKSDKLSLAPRNRLSLQHNGRYEHVLEVEYYLEGANTSAESLKHNSGPFSSKIIRKKSSPLYLPNFTPRGNKERGSEGGEGGGEGENHTGKPPRHPIVYYPSLSSFKDLSPLPLSSLSPSLRHAVTLFASSPSAAMEYLIGEGVIKDKARHIARFLYKYNSVLDKKQIGEYLSNPDELSAKVLEEFVKRMNFTFNDYDLALRKFLYHFRLPGEAQRIDRFVRQFAKCYYHLNTLHDVPLFPSELAAYALTFGTIMLNTDAHNENVKYKMTEKQFIENILYAAGCAHLPVEFLSDLYYRVNTEEIKFTREEVRLPHSVKKGWISLKSRNLVGAVAWKKRWLILSHRSLLFLRRPDDDQCLFAMRVENFSVARAELKKRKYCVRLSLPIVPHNLRTSVEDQKGQVLISFPTEREAQSWLLALSALLSLPPSSSSPSLLETHSNPLTHRKHKDGHHHHRHLHNRNNNNNININSININNNSDINSHSNNDNSGSEKNLCNNTL